MATQHNFRVKNGLEVGGQEVISSSGVVTSAALGGQTLASTDSPTFNNLTLTNDIAVGGDLNLTGDLNITGDVNSLSVTDLDVTDQTITLGAGQVESASGGSGIIVAGSNASILWDETNNRFNINSKLEIAGGGLDINGTDELRYRMLNNGNFKGGIEVVTTNGDMIATSAIDDLAIRSQANILFSGGGNTEALRLNSTGGIISRSTGASYAGGTVAGLFVDATGRGTVRIRSEADAASELFFDVDGGISWDISARQSSENYNLHFYNRVQASDTLTTVDGPTVVFAQTGNVGIAELTPDERLSLDGNIRFNTSVTTNSTRPSITAATLANGEIRAKNANTGDGGLLRLSAGGGTNANQVSFIDIMGYSNGGGTGPKSIVMGTQGADRLVINENGLATFTGPAAQVNLGGNAAGSSALYVNSTSGHTGEMIQILKDSVTRMHMANNGNLGIGVVPSVGKLHVAGKIYSTTEVQGGSALIGTSNSLATFGSNNSSTGISISRDSNASSYPDIVVTGAGRVGIGVAAPDADFHINQGPDNRVLITSNGPTLIFKEANTTDDNFGFYLNSSIFNLNTYNDSFGLLSTPLSIKMDGNIGINDTDPDELIAARGTNCVLKLDGTASSSGVASVQYASQGTVKWSAGISKNSSQSAGDWSIFEDGASANPRFTVKDGGSVTIGTTTDNGRKFTVYGSGDLMQLRSTNSGVGGAQLDLTHISSSPADGDLVGIINMSSATKQYASVRGISSNVNDEGELHLGVRTSSTEYEGSAFQILGDTSLKHKQTSTNTMMFGTPGGGATVESCWLSIEGNADTSGEGSGRIFFREHNSTTAAMDSYGMSLGYRGGATTLTSAGGNTWDGLGDIGNGSWGMWGHDADASGNLIMYGSRSGAGVTIAGSLSKSSGSFKIPHPLPSKADTHKLVHSFIEGPQADNIYRGVIDLVDGTATINIDTVSGMTEGTFVLLNTNTSCFTSNETDWDAVKGSVSGNILTINCQNSSSTATVSWLVIGERHDQHMIDTDWTDENGKVIVEPANEAALEDIS